jgi:ketoreductase RED2
MDGRVAIVTGSTSGIGAAVARQIVQHGGKVVLNSVRSEEQGHALAAELGDAAVYCRADVSIPTEAHTVVQTAIDRFGRLDVLVNNAGTTVRIPLEEIDAVTMEIWDKILRTNLLGPWLLVQSARPALKATGEGVVINISSIAGTNPSGSSIPYSVSKAGLNQLTRLLATVLGPEIRVNAVSPGFVETPWTAEWPDRKERAIAMSPLARIAQPDDIAEVCMMLMRARHVTGEVIHVDGGQRFG